LWVHYLDPHAPYRPPENWPRRFTHSGAVAIPPGRIPEVAAEPDVVDALDYVDAYDEEIAYTDAQVDRLLEGYARLAPIDRALLIFTSDHGETLIGRPIWFGHMWQVFEELVRVPLWIRGPGVTTGRRTELVSGIDVVPTVLAFAGAAVPPELRGADLRAPLADRDRTVFAETSIRFSHLRAAIGRNAKWVAKLTLGDRKVRSRVVYDLEKDPGERHPVPWSQSSAPAAELLYRILTDPDPGGAPTDFRRGDLGQQSRDALRELGYAE
jgi:arylsulfatase A-like enzyme